MTIEEINAKNLAAFEALKNSGTGEHNLDYIVPGTTRHLKINIPEGDIYNGIVFDLPGIHSGGKSQDVENYNNSNNTHHIDVFYSGSNYNGAITTNSTENVSNYDKGINGFGQSYPDLAHEFINEYGADPNILYHGFSLGADHCVHMAAYHAKKYPDDNIAAVSINPDWNYALSETERQALIDSDAKILMVFSQDRFYNNFNTQSSINTYNGVNLYELKINITGNNVDQAEHVLPEDLLVEYGITNLASGGFNFNDLPSEYVYKRNNQTYSLSYEIIEKYTNENGEYVSRTLTLDEANSIFSGGAYSADVIRSDNEYLSQALTSINSKLSSLMNSQFNFAVSSTTAVPAREVALLNQLMNAIKDLCFLVFYHL
jgi:hypothetical protein